MDTDASLYEYDVIVVGSGAAGLTAAVTAALRGLSVLIIEKAEFFGGTTAFSGAAAWIPNNFYLKNLSLGWVLPKVGLGDSTEKARAYLDGLVGPKVTPARLDAFLSEGPKMIEELHARIGLRWRHWPFPDYFAEHLGGMTYGRTIEPDIFDGRKLGAELKTLRPQSAAFGIKGLVMTGMEGLNMASGMGDIRGPRAVLTILFRSLCAKLTGAKLMANGQSLLAQLRVALIQMNVPLWLSTPMTGLVTEGAGHARRVTGVLATRGGKPITIRSTRGVILATGGFATSQEMRERFLPKPTRAEWSLVPRDGQDGDGQCAAEAIGAALELTDKAWGFPAALLPMRDGMMAPRMALWERMKPGVIVVNGAGKRYFDEGITYEETWKMMYAKNAEDAPTIPSWMVFDARAKRKYAFFNVPPAIPFPKRWLQGGHVHRAESLDLLASKIGVPADALKQTVERYNSLARGGHDDDFNRGDTVWARYWGDGRAQHPNLGPLERGPFYAIAIWPGDLSTKGGVLVDEHARVLRSDGLTIEGLFACGNVTASVMGDTYPGGGGTIGPAMTLGYIAASRLAENV